MIPTILLARLFLYQWPEVRRLRYLTLPSVVAALAVGIRWDYRSPQAMARMPAERMTPIHELLSRIRHDRQFGASQSEIGYFDRRQNAVHRIALKRIVFPAGERRVFEFVDEAGQAQRIPFHRVREAYRDGHRIWQRPSAQPPDLP